MRLWNYMGFRIEREAEDGPCVVYPMSRCADGWIVDRSLPQRFEDLDSAMRAIRKAVE